MIQKADFNENGKDNTTAKLTRCRKNNVEMHIINKNYLYIYCNFFDIVTHFANSFLRGPSQT